MADITLASEPASVPAARRFVRDFLAAEGVDSAIVLPAVLLTSEVVTNAVIHGDSAVELRIDASTEGLRVEVCDHGPGCPVPLKAPPEADRGRGLDIVSQMASRWGVVFESDHKSVWFELRCPRSPSARERRVLMDNVAVQARHATRRRPRRLPG